MDYIKFLSEHDDPVHWESPPGFDYKAAISRFEKRFDALSIALDFPTHPDTGQSIQDASFHSQVSVQYESDHYALVRFSNFGDMVSIATCVSGEMLPEGEEEQVPTELRDKIIDVIEVEAYVYVPAEILMQPYTGKNPGVTGIRDWWIRYFDWV